MIHRFGRSCVFVCLLLAFAAPTAAFAQGDAESESGDADYDANLDQAARRVFMSARQAFSAGEYEVALERFRQAYQLSPRPTLLYNIAATLDRLRRDEEALEGFKAYLEASPDAEDRTEIEARIRVLEEAVARRQAAAPPPDTTVPDDTPVGPTEPTEPIEPDPVDPVRPEPEESGGLHPAIFIATGGAALVVGGLLVWSGLDAKGKDDDVIDYVDNRATNGATLAEGEQMLDDAESAALRTNVLMGVTIALGATAAVLAIFTDWGGDEDEPSSGSLSLGGAAGPDGGMVGLQGTF